MSDVATFLRTALCTAVLPPGLIGYSASALAFASLGMREAAGASYPGFANLCLRMGSTDLHVRGLEHARPGRSYVIVANHESNWDPIALVAAFKDRAVRFVIKKQIINIPIFGHALLATGNMMVERANTAADVARIRRGMENRALDVSILFYPEGTRSRDGALHEFKKGAFSSAIAYGLPLLPVGHAGTFHVWPPGKLAIRKNPVVVEIGPEIPIEGLTLDDREKLRDRSRQAIATLRQRARDRVRELGGETGGID